MTALDPGPRVAVISGGSRGLGRLLVEALLKSGWNVATLSRTENAFIAKTTAAAGDDFFWQPVDLTATEMLAPYVQAVIRRFGRIDLLVNNGGLLHQELLLTTPRSQVEQLITANLVAPIVMAQSCARAMTRTGGGQVINVSSINAIRGFRGVAVYSAAKAGLDGFGRSLARELGPLNIRVNSVMPGYFASAMTAEVTSSNREKISRRTPLGRLGTAEDVLGVVSFLISPAGAFITGQTIVVDGGITC